MIVLLQAERTLSQRPSRWSHTLTAPHVSCWMVLLDRAASPPSAPRALVQMLWCAPLLPTGTSTNIPFCYPSKDEARLQGWLCTSSRCHKSELGVHRGGPFMPKSCSEHYCFQQANASPSPTCMALPGIGGETPSNASLPVRHLQFANGAHGAGELQVSTKVVRIEMPFPSSVVWSFRQFC